VSKFLKIPESECDYFFVLEESLEFALICIKGFEFIVMNQPRFIEDIKTGNLHEVQLEINGQTRSLSYVSHKSLEQREIDPEIALNDLMVILAVNNINLN
jgi:hypothetical protein